MKRTVVPVALDARGYEVVIGADLLEEAGARIKALAPHARVCVVADAGASAAQGERLRDGLARAGLAPGWVEVAAGEHSKSFPELARVCDRLIAERLERKDLVIAFGGGVVGDLAGLAAGLVKRGLDYVQIPTTLLAQVDSSVGGKTAIDTAAGKNLVGLFHQPKLVLADLTALNTLPAREIGAGLAEVVKYGLIEDAAFFAACVAQAGALRALQTDTIETAVAHCVCTKARIVAEDEREAGARALLNLGHTFGHAIEAAAGYDGAILHGEAVAIGMRMAFEFSATLGLCTDDDARSVRAGLAALELPVETPAFARAAGVDALLEAMANDKKNESGRLTLILARGIGKSFVMKDAPVDRLRAYLQTTV